MNIIDELKNKEQLIKELQSKKDRQEGQKAQLFTQLKTEFGVDTLEDAVKLLETLQTGVVENETKLQKLDTEMGSIILTAQNRQ
jgi:hypothetical protein